MERSRNLGNSLSTKKLFGTPGERLKYLKLLVRFKCHEIGYVLKEVSKKLTLNHFDELKNLDIPEPTIRKWESGERTLTENGIDKCVEAFGKLGIIVSRDWLKSGRGIFPSIKQPAKVEYLKRLNDNKKIYLSYLDKKERLIYVDKGYDHLFSEPVEKIIGKSLAQLLSPKSYAVQKEIIQQALHGVSRMFEYPWEYEPNKYKTVKISFIPDFDSKNTVVRGIFSFLEEMQETKATHPSAHEDEEEASNFYFEQNLYLKIIIEIEGLLKTQSSSCSLRKVTKLAEDIFIFCKSSGTDDYHLPAVVKEFFMRVFNST